MKFLICVPIRTCIPVARRRSERNFAVSVLVTKNLCCQKKIQFSFNYNIEINIADFESLNEIHFLYHRRFFKKEIYENSTRLRERLIRKLNGLLEQKRENRRVDLEIYFDGFPYRDDLEFREFVLSAANRLRPFRNQVNFNEYPGPKTFSDFARWIRNSKIENTSKSLCYYGNPDQGAQVTEMVNRMDETTFEKFSRSIALLFVGQISIKYARELRYKELFKYVTCLYLRRLPQKTLDLFPGIVPNVVHVTYYELESDMTNCKFLLKFKSMKLLGIDYGALTINELKEILGSDKMWVGLKKKEEIDYSIRIQMPGDGTGTLKIKGEKINFQHKVELLEHLDKTGLLKNEFYERFFEFNYNLHSITFEDYYLNYD